LLFHENLIAEYEEGSPILKFYESPIGRISYKVLTTLQLRTTESKIDLKPSKPKDLLKDRETTEKLLKVIEENDIGYLFSYNIVLKQNIFMAT
jgi:hypothetical protein